MSAAPRRPPFEIPATGIADENDRFWERPEGAEPVSATPAREAAAGGEQPAGCVLLGPSQVGKTSLLMAIERACSLPAPDEPDLLFVPEPDTALLIQKAVRLMINPGDRAEATRAAASYHFHIRAEEGDGARALRFPPVTMVLSDGPGGALFPAELGDRVLADDYRRWREQMVDRARRAKAIVFCVSAVEPRSDRWQEHLSVLLAEMKQRQEPPAGGPQAAQPQGRTSPRAAPLGRMTLEAERVLVLLTKVDQLCDQVRNAMERVVAEMPEAEPLRAVRRNLAGLSSAQLAAGLDPIQQAREALGVHVLNQVRYALRPDARLAVGVCSSGGFDPRTGETYWTETGKPRTLSAETGDEILRRWVPFGVRDAVFFIATGEARGMVRRVHRNNLLLDPQALPVKIDGVTTVETLRPSGAVAVPIEEG